MLPTAVSPKCRTHFLVLCHCAIGQSVSHAALRAQTLREVFLDLLQGLPLRLQQAEVQEHDADAADGSVEEKGAVQSQGMFNVQECLRTEK